MARYSYIFTQIWKDRKFRQLDDSGQKLFIALLSAPSSNMVGYYNWPLAYALHDLNGWDEAKFRHYMIELERAGMAAYDFEAEVVLVSNFLKYNPITNIKQLAGAFSQVQEVPLSPLFRRFYEIWKTHVEELYRKLMDEKLSKAADEKEKASCLKSISEADRVSGEMKRILEAVSIPYPEEKSDCESTKTYPIDRVSIPYPSPMDTLSNEYGSGIDDQVQVQVQVQVQSAGTDTEREAHATNENPPDASEGELSALNLVEDIPESTGGKKQDGQVEGDAGAPPVRQRSGKVPIDCPFGEILALYHEILPELPKVRESGKTFRQHLGARWTEKAERRSLDWWREYFESIRNMDWLMGRVTPRNGGAPFMANLDWLVSPENMKNVLNGRYARGKTTNAYQNAASRDPDEILQEAFAGVIGDDYDFIDAEVSSRD